MRDTTELVVTVRVDGADQVAGSLSAVSGQLNRLTVQADGNQGALDKLGRQYLSLALLSAQATGNLQRDQDRLLRNLAANREWLAREEARLTGDTTRLKILDLDRYLAQVRQHTTDEGEVRRRGALRWQELNRSSLDKMLDQWRNHNANLAKLTENLLSSLQSTWSGWLEKALLGEFENVEDALSGLGDAFVKILAQMAAAWVANESLAGMASFFQDLKSGLSGGNWSFGKLGSWWDSLWSGANTATETAALHLDTSATALDTAAAGHSTAASGLSTAAGALSAAAQALAGAAAVGGGGGGGISIGLKLPGWGGDGESGDAAWGDMDWGDWDGWEGLSANSTNFRSLQNDWEGINAEITAAQKEARLGLKDYLGVLTSAYALYAGLSGLADENRSKISSTLQAAGGAAGLYTNQALRSWLGLGQIGAGGQAAVAGIGMAGAGYGLYQNFQSIRDQGLNLGNGLGAASNAYNLYNAGKGLYTAYQTWQGVQAGAQGLSGGVQVAGNVGVGTGVGASSQGAALSPGFSWSNLGSGLTTAGAGMAGGIAGNYFISQTIAKDRPQAMYGAAGGALAGATIGSIIPGIGTAIGAGLGALFGAIFGGAGAGLFGGSVKKPANERLGSTERQYKAWTNLTNLAGVNPEYMRGLGSERLDLGRNTAFLEIDKSLKLGGLSQELREMALETDTGAASLKNMLENLDPVKLAMGRAMEAYHDFNLQVKDTVASSTQGALEFDGYASSGQHLSEKMSELAHNLGLPEEQTQALTGKVDQAITTWQQFGGSTDELTRKLENEFANALLDSVQAGEEDLQMTQAEQAAKEAMIAELDAIIAARQGAAAATEEEQAANEKAQATWAELQELVAGTGAMGQFAAQSLGALSLAFESGQLNLEEYRAAQEDIAEHLRDYNEMLADQTRRTTEAATAEELLIAGMQNAAIVSQIQADYYAQNGQALSLLDAQTQALTGSIDQLLTVNSLDALEQREMVNLLLFQSGRTEELTNQYKRYQEIKEQLTKAHTMERAEVEKLVAEGRELARQLGYTQEATEDQTDAATGSKQPNEDLAKALEGVADAVDGLKQLLEALPASGTTWDWYMNGHFNLPSGGTGEGETPPSHHTGAYIYHHGGQAGLPSFHTGGLAADEVLAILQKGEGVINKQSTAALGGPAAIAALNSVTASSLTTAADQTDEETQRLAEAYAKAIQEMQSWDAAWLRERFTAEQQAGDQLIQERNRQMEQVKAWEEEGTITHEEAAARRGLIDQQWAADVVKLREEVTKAFEQTMADFWEGQKSQAEQAHDAIMQQNQDLLDELQRQYESGAIGTWEEYQKRRLEVEAMTDKQLQTLRSEAYQSLQAIVDNSLKGELSATGQQVQTLNDTYRDHLRELEDYYRAGAISQQDAQKWRLALQENYQRELEQITKKGLDQLESLETSALGQRKDRQEELLSELLATEGLTQEGIQSRIAELMGVNQDLAGLEKDQKVLDSLQNWLTSPFTNATEAAALVTQARDLYESLGFQQLGAGGGLAGSAVGVIGDQEFLQGWTVSDPITDPGALGTGVKVPVIRGLDLPGPIGPAGGGKSPDSAYQARPASPEQQPVQVVINVGQVGQLADAVIEASVKEFRTFLYQEQARQAQTGGPKPYTTSISRPALAPVRR
ncbi:MAG: hypothetical protein KQJ78_18320 [Deltaproteobacteria bacterium]|nr:hypothetical protein [Deltaproteobacteria bacterium]